VVVARIQIKNLKIEVEKGFRRTLFEPELVDPNKEINFVNDLKRVTKDCSKSNFKSILLEREIV
jgi:hypothetical protein